MKLPIRASRHGFTIPKQHRWPAPLQGMPRDGIKVAEEWIGVKRL